MGSRVQADINLQALTHNLKRVCNLAPNSKIMAMIKADGYGHGLVQIARALNNADAFGVACLNEALILRKAGVSRHIAIMSCFSEAKELPVISKHDLEIVIHNENQLDILDDIELSKPIGIWLKIDSGMHRLGFDPEQIGNVYERLLKSNKINKPINFMTHLAAADDFSTVATEKQIEIFRQTTDKFDGCKSIANSAGIIGWPKAHSDWVRPGIMLYGISPFSDKTGADFNLYPVMSLRSKLIAVKQLKKGDRVGYEGTWACPEDMPVGVAAIGYGDGYPRHAKNGTPVLVNGIKCQLAGRVSMDMITIDLRNNPTAKCNAPVVLWGDGLPIEHVAKSADTIAYELLCGITQRVKFIYSI